MTLCTLWSGCATRPQEKTDEALNRSVKQAFYDRDDVNLLRVDITVEDGVVYLDGEVEEMTHKIEAERAARRVEGIVGVVNKLQLLP